MARNQRLSQATTALAQALSRLLESHTVSPFVVPSSKAEKNAEMELQQLAAHSGAMIQRLASTRRSISGSPTDPQFQASISDPIAGPAQAVADATTSLLSAAARCEAERHSAAAAVSTGGQPYHIDSMWTEGLVSAGRAVATASQEAVRAADEVVRSGGVGIERAQAAVRTLSSATAQLIAASTTHAPAFSSALPQLRSAAVALNNAATHLTVAFSSASQTHQQLAGSSPAGGGLLNMAQTQAAEIDAQARIIRLQNELELAHNSLHNMRKARYQPPGGGSAFGSNATPSQQQQQKSNRG